MHDFRLDNLPIKEKYRISKVEDKEVTDFSRAIKDEAKGPKLNIVTNLGKRWMSNDLSILRDKHYEEDMDIRLVFRQPNQEIMALTTLFGGRIRISRDLSLPPINILKDKVALYHENEKKNLREAILIENGAVASYFEREFETGFRGGVEIPDIKLYPFLYDSIMSLEKRVAEALKKPDEAAKKLKLTFLTDAKKYRLFIALYFLQKKDNRPYTVKELSEACGISTKTIYAWIAKIRQPQNASLRRNIEAYIPYPHMLKLTEEGLKNVPKLLEYWILQEDLKKEGILPSGNKKAVLSKNTSSRDLA